MFSLSSQSAYYKGNYREDSKGKKSDKIPTVGKLGNLIRKTRYIDIAK